jgi:predicted Rossmann fold flavoprotein
MNSDPVPRVVIIGAGAAGLATAIFAAQHARQARTPLSVILVDGADHIGRKILIAGGGRCNVTNAQATPADFNGTQTVIRNVLRTFDEKAAWAWFESIGVALKIEDTGKVFPKSDKAMSVLTALIDRMRALGITLRTGARVRSIQRRDSGGFTLGYEGGAGPDDAREADFVVLATGGKTVPSTGSDGAGFALAQALGHSLVRSSQALVPLLLADQFFHAKVSGVSHEATITTRVAGKVLDRRSGSLLWTHFGLSGPLALDASRHLTTARDAGLDATMELSALPDTTFEQADAWLESLAQQRPRALVTSAIGEKLPQSVADTLINHALTPDGRVLTLARMSRDQRRALAHALTALPLPVTGPRGWNYGEVTAGGVPLAEIDWRTMASRPAPGLYLVGEILDCDGRIGGFNFQWAWATGFIAGRALAQQATQAAQASLPRAAHTA